MAGPWKGVKVRLIVSGVTIECADDMTVTPHFEGGLEYCIGTDIGVHVDGPKSCDVSITRKFKNNDLFWRLFIERLEFTAFSEIKGQGTSSRLTASGVKMYDYERPVGGPGETVVETLSGQARDFDAGNAI